MGSEHRPQDGARQEGKDAPQDAERLVQRRPVGRRLVLWFRGDMVTPVYSLDSRGELISLVLQTTHRF